MDQDEQSELNDSTKDPITPAIEKLVDFYGDQIPAAQTEQGDIYIPLRPLTSFLGVSFGSQRNRIMRDEALADQVRSVLWQAADGKRYEMLSLPIDLLPGWLFGISASRVKDELRDKIMRYRRECFRALWNAFKVDILPAAPVPLNLSPAEQAMETARALLHLAEQQVAFERALQAHEQAIQSVEGTQQAMADFMRPFVAKTRETLRRQDSVVIEHGERINSLELQLSAGATIDTAQQSELQLAVKAVAQALEQTEPLRAYQRVYGEIYRRYGISGYKQLPRAQYASAMAWLRQWFGELNGQKS